MRSGLAAFTVCLTCLLLIALVGLVAAATHGANYQ